MAQICNPGYYFDDTSENCRDCDLVCGIQYAGPYSRECVTLCPGYVLSTTYAAVSTSLAETSTSPPAYENPLWLFFIVPVVIVPVVLLIIIGIIIFRRKHNWLKLRKREPLVTVETADGHNAPSRLQVSATPQQPYEEKEEKEKFTV